MALRLCIPNAVPLPPSPALARSIAFSADFGDTSLGLSPGEVVNITNSTPDGSMIFGIACSGSEQRKGWLPRDAVQPLPLAEIASVPTKVRLSLRELVQHSTLVCVDQDWQDRGQPSSLYLRAGQVLQVSTVREGWAYGWPLESPSRHGWFPLAFAHPVESSVPSLVSGKDQELCAAASASVQELLRSKPLPPPVQWAWEGELPAAVAESVQRGKHEWQAQMSRMEAQQAAAAPQEPDIVDGGGADDAAADAAELETDVFTIDNMPEASYPLVVCKTAFAPPRGTGYAMLSLQVSDLVRVTSVLEASMYHGFMEGKQETRGWFPRRNVHLLEDPLSNHANSMPAQIGPPPLPVVPPSLQRRMGP